MAQKYGGDFHLRFDDTNPAKENKEFVESIVKDVEWLGAKYVGGIRFASNFFDKMYECAEILINKGLSFVCDLSAEEVSTYRGNFNTPGKNSLYRDRSIEENLRLFREMRVGKYPDKSKTLLAKIDMSSPNLNMRDSVHII